MTVLSVNAELGLIIVEFGTVLGGNYQLFSEIYGRKRPILRL